MNNILQYNDYYAAIEFDAADEVFHGKLLGINDLVSFEGTSVRELKKAFREAVEDYLETCKSMGRYPEKFYKGSLMFAFLQNSSKSSFGIGSAQYVSK